MATNTRNSKPRKRKRQPLVMPEPISDTLDNVVGMVLTTKPKKRKNWRFIQERDRGAKPTDVAR